MTPHEYIKKLITQKDGAVSRFDNLSSLETDVVEGSFDWLLSNLDIKGGSFLPPKDLPQLMDDFVNSVLKITTTNAKFKTSFEGLLSDMEVIAKNTEDFQLSFNKISLQKAGLKDVQQIVVGETIKQFKQNGLNVHFAAPLRDGIFNNILAGMNQRQAKQYLQEYILSGKDRSGKLHSYLEQTAIQAVDSYSGAINQKLYSTFSDIYTGYIISGSLIKTSSTQCKYAVDHSKEGYLTFTEWEKILKMAKENPKARLIDGTTIKNLPLNKLHWGCRHEFTPVIIE